ncbi:YbaL family putative K(+) efflux transporter [Rhizobium paknamense]|uniref:CPA2 family monovalent cation:H+ antiporter-2 n=1 Tax=Rhizobium paknamense TaxID=1206817 RepID=A0ABU0IF82_9HYPH|nr:YbaL family putative K(+) efflux transporter [Rhizobium paknamense]MDQ0456899.1 CPA2 family monovalent cation:H+ antiporter-2 [Rhizobium paknamense]
MPHATPLITILVAGFVLAFLFGTLANRFKLPPLVGYLLAGIVVGPYTPGYVADQALALELAEIGVILLMFGVGLHFSLKDLLSVRFIALPGALVQIGFATFLGWGLGLAFGWSHGAGLVFGLALSVASTVVLLKALQERRLVESEKGKIAVGWLIVEDLAMVLALVLIPAIAGASGDGHGGGGGDPLALWLSQLAGFQPGVGAIIAVTLLKVVAFIGFMMIVGRRVIPWALHYTAHTGSRELFRLGVLAIALGVAFGAAKLFGVSLALGAFFAGMILSESELSHRAAQESLPLRDAFSVLFFVSVGMLFDPMSVMRDPLPMLATIGIIIVGKSLAAFLIVIAFRRSMATALIISASLAQIGEFSFILAELGVGLNILPEEGRHLILGGAIISIILNPLVFLAVDWLRPWLEKRYGSDRTQEKKPQDKPAETIATGEAAAAAAPAAPAEEPDDVPVSLSGHVIVVGYGRVGSVVAEELQKSGHPVLVIEDAERRLQALNEQNLPHLAGNGAQAGLLERANLAGASALVMAIPNAFEAGQIALQAKKINPAIRVIGRAHSDAEVEHLQQLGTDEVVMGEREIARAMAHFMTAPPQAVPA